MTDTVVDAVRQVLEGTNRPALVVADDALVPADLGGSVGGEVVVLPVASAPIAPGPDGSDPADPDTRRFAAVVLVVADVAELRRTVSVLGGPRGLGRARTVAVVVADADAPLLLRPHPSWPRVVDLEARSAGGPAVTAVTFGGRPDVVPVLVALARGAALPVTSGPGGVWLGGAVAPPVDPVFTLRYDPGLECPPDVITGGDASYEPSPVTGRAPVGVPRGAAPLDEAVYNPHGFRREWTRGMVDLPPGTRLSPALVASLRDAQGARPAAGADPAVAAELAAGLAMCGIPMERIDEPVERERHSVRTRRAALLEHATFAWRSRLGDLAGVRHDLLPGELRVSPEVSGDPDAVTDLTLARRYSGADLVVLPDDPTGLTECFVTEPPAGAVAHLRDRTPADVLAAGGLVYVTRPASIT